MDELKPELSLCLRTHLGLLQTRQLLGNTTGEPLTPLNPSHVATTQALHSRDTVCVIPLH